MKIFNRMYSTIYTFLHVVLYFSILTIVLGYQNFTDKFEYSELRYHHTVQGNNGNITVDMIINRSNSGLIFKEDVTACVSNSSDVAVEMALDHISTKMLNLEAKSNSNNKGVGHILGEFVVKMLRTNDAYYDKMKLFYVTPEDKFVYNLDENSRVVHRCWAINEDDATGTLHVFIYPAMAPGDVCVTPAKGQQSGSAAVRDESHHHICVINHILVIFLVHYITH